MTRRAPALHLLHQWGEPCRLAGDPDRLPYIQMAHICEGSPVPCTSALQLCRVQAAADGVAGSEETWLCSALLPH